MRRQLACLAVIFFGCALPPCTAQEARHVTVAGREVAMWTPPSMAPPDGYPLIIFSHGFGGCNTQTKFLMEALASAGYLVLAPNHKDARCAACVQPAGGKGHRYLFAPPASGMKAPTPTGAKTWRRF